MDSPARWLQKHFDYSFADEALLQRALTHRSSPGHNNERLEFLGDSVLNFVATDIVYRLESGADEGRLSRMRATLVRDATLAEIAQEIGLGDHLILGPGELKSGGYRRASILADAVEAILGAIYLDRGFAAADRAVRHLLEARIAELPNATVLKDAKTRLQEWLQAASHDLPVYRTDQVSGKAHRQVFDVTCLVEALGRSTTGRGSSRREAEQEAARQMLEALDDSGGHKK